MANLSKFIHSRSGRIVSSVILGLGLASLFRKLCNGGSCVVYKGVPITEISGKVFQYNDKCYTFTAIPVTCDKTKQIVDFA